MSAFSSCVLPARTCSLTLFMENIVLDDTLVAHDDLTWVCFASHTANTRSPEMLWILHDAASSTSCGERFEYLPPGRWSSYFRKSLKEGRTNAKYWLVWLLNRHVWQLVSNAPTKEHCDVGWRSTLRFFRKSRNANWVKQIPNTHSTASLTEYIARLKSCCCSVRFAPLNGHMR